MRLILVGWLVLGLTWCTELMGFQRTEKVSVEALLYELDHPEADHRKKAAAVLGDHRIRAAVPALIKRTEDSETEVRLEALKALVRINDTRALPAYVRLTRDGNTEIQRKSVEGIINLYVVEEGGFISGIRKFVQVVNPFSDDYNPLVVESYVQVDEEALQAIAALLSSRDDKIREDAAVALGILRGRSALPSIRQSLASEKDSDVRVKLIRAMYKIADSQAAADLVPLVNESDRRVRDEAIVTLGQLRVTEAVPALRQVYESGVEERKKILGVVPISGSDDLQRRVFEALAYIGDGSCQDIFLPALNDERDFFRRYAAEGLARGTDAGVITQIGRKYVREQSGTAKLAMSFALYRMGREEHLLELIDNSTSDQGYYYLLELPEQEIKLLYPHVPLEKDAVKIRLLDVIGLKADQSCLPLLERMQQDPNADVASAANLALRRIRGRFNLI